MAAPQNNLLLPAAWDVPAEFRRRLGDQAGRQRAMSAEGHLLLVLHAPPGADTMVREGRLFWRDAGGGWTPSGEVDGEPGLGALLAEYEKAIEGLQHDEDAAQTAREYFELLGRINPMVRATRNLYKALQEGREASPDDRQLLLWRDRADSVMRSAELLHADADNALDFAVALRAEEEVEANRRTATASHRLNMMAALFLPLATLAAFFGMNFHHGLEQWDQQFAPWPALAVLGAGIVCGVLLTLFIRRKP